MGALRLAFLNIGQGDTIIIYDPDSKEAVVVDCVNFLSVFEFFEAKGLNRLRALILTHPHSDHFLGAVGLLNSCERRGITLDACIFRWDKDFLRMPEFLSDSDSHSEAVSDKKRSKSNYQALISWATQPINKRKHIEPFQLPKDSRILNALKFLHPEHADIQELFETRNLNNLSYVIQVSDSSSALLTGDIEPAGWTFLRNNYPGLLANTILKFPHHGVWRSGDVAQLLEEVNPQIVVISV
jgi:competence protein ComEC